MAVIKCKMCGGDLQLVPGSTVAVCEYCGSRQTVPSADSDKKLTLFARANRLRSACEFDKAAGVYEAIVADFPEEAEAYWGLVLCKYGIEYVDDPATGKKIPTCHRSSFDSVMDDNNYEQALENADVTARKVYREEAKQIEELRKGIIAVSSKESPYDIFICYKETDENGDRTLDSVLAQDVYDALNEKGYRVFFSRISLEEKLGQEYEPYIFAALNSAKIMLVVGTDYEYFNAVWVKNEWSRFLHLISSGQKKTLIPCYKNIDAYDMPREFAKLQAQDLGKIGAMQDLLRGIEKVINKPALTDTNMQNAAQEAVRTIEQEKIRKQIENAISLGIMAVDSEDIPKATKYFEEALKLDSECIGAYLGLVRIAKNNTAYVKKINSLSISSIIEYLKTHSAIIGNTDNSNNLLTISVWLLKSEKLVEALLDIGVNPNAKNALIHFVNQFDNYTIVQKFISGGANVDATYWWKYNYKVHKYDISDDHESYDLHYHSVLSTAVTGNKSFQIISALIQAGANVNHIVKVYTYYHKVGESSKGSLERSFSILNSALFNRQHDIAELLLKNGASPDFGRIIHKSFGDVIYFKEDLTYTNLYDAICTLNDKKMLELLLLYKANPNKVIDQPIWRKEKSRSVLIGFSKRTILIDAIFYSDDLEVIEILIKHGADPQAKYTYVEGRFNSNETKTVIPALGIAVEKQKTSFVQALISYGASFAEQVIYDPKGADADSFPLAELAFGEKVVNGMGDVIRPLGWKGSKSGWFRKQHVCHYSW